MEIVTGIAAIAFGLALWNDGWWHWILIGVGLVGVLPWLGARSILKRAEKDPDVLVSDPARRRARGQRAVMVQVPVLVLVGAVIGYATDGWSGALSIGAVMGASAALGAWLYLRWQRDDL